MPKTNKYEWHEPNPPLVTKCCASFCWEEVTGEKNGTLCLQCSGIGRDNLRFASDSEINNRHIIADIAILQRKYNSLMTRMLDIIKNHKTKNHGKES